MQILERFLCGKSGGEVGCEDAIVVTTCHAAVVDGATDKSGSRYGGLTGGQLAAAACVEAVRQLPHDADAAAAVATMTKLLASQLPTGARPAASVTVYSAQRREVWQVGDVGYWWPGLARGAGQPRRLVDQVAGDFRAAVLAAIGPVDPAASDPGREAIMPLLARQGALANRLDTPWGYPVIDGTPVPASMITVVAVPAKVGELVLASDGYREILPTLAETERRLAAQLAEDPWCVGPLRGTKAVTAGNLSFDDRAWLRLHLPA